jgi:hypothetical protein
MIRVSSRTPTTGTQLTPIFHGRWLGVGSELMGAFNQRWPQTLRVRGIKVRAAPGSGGD